MVEILVKMKAALSKSLVLGLCAYLRQLELSIDRSLGNLADFKTYCEIGPIERLPRVIERLGAIIPQANRAACMKSETTLPSLFMRFQSWCFKSRVDIDDVLLVKIHDLLQKIAARLNAYDGLSRDEFIEIRLALNKAASHLSCYIFPISKRNAVLNIEHLNQNPILKTNSLESITGEVNWLFS